jgi:hypothetical protein
MGAGWHFLLCRYWRADIKGKVKQAFSNGFLGLDSMGFSTLVSIVTVKPDDLGKIEKRLCSIFMTEFGAPDEAAAMAAVMEEIKFMADLCAEHKNRHFACDSA